MDPVVGKVAVPEAPERAAGRSILRAGRGLLESAVALLVPGDCRSCGVPLLGVSAIPVCTGCLGGLQRSAFAACERCGNALGMEAERAAGLSRADEVLCEACTTDLPEYLRARAFGDYAGVLRRLIHLHKFEGVRALAAPLGARMADVLEEASAGANGRLVVVAVPLFRGKRPWNQSALLAAEAMRVLRRRRPMLRLETAHEMLRRTRWTESQMHLSPRQRRENVRGAFAVAGDVRGLHVVLVDDIYTTGATARECTRVLLRAGAATVRVVTLARAQENVAAVWDAVPTAPGSGLRTTD